MSDPVTPDKPAAGRDELTIRVCSALLLIVLAIGAAYLGGWPFAVFWCVAGLGVLWEWTALVTPADYRLSWMAGAAALVIAVILVARDNAGAGAIVLGIGIIAAAAAAPRDRRGWTAAGLPYAATLAIAPVLLRADVKMGFLAIGFLFAVVWSTDIAAYFIGRTLGGPKLMPAVSPGKTWSGAVGGVLASLVVTIALASAAGLARLSALAALAVALSIVSQIGDLFESKLKRRFGAKNSSHLIPGHGGLLDRLDGFVAAAAFAALLGIVRGGMAAPAQGLLSW